MQNKCPISSRVAARRVALRDLPVAESDTRAWPPSGALNERVLACTIAVQANPRPSTCDSQSPGRNRFGSIRFGSGLFENSSVRFGSDFCFPRFDAFRPAFFGRVVAWSGLVRFVSASGSGWFQNETVRFTGGHDQGCLYSRLAARRLAKVGLSEL